MLPNRNQSPEEKLLHLNTRKGALFLEMLKGHLGIMVLLSPSVLLTCSWYHPALVGNTISASFRDLSDQCLHFIKVFRSFTGTRESEKCWFLCNTVVWSR